MNQGIPSDQFPMSEPQKKRNTWLIVVIAAVVLCCICLIAGGVFWQFGDQILQALGLA